MFFLESLQLFTVQSSQMQLKTISQILLSLSLPKSAFSLSKIFYNRTRKTFLKQILQLLNQACVCI